MTDKNNLSEYGPPEWLDHDLFNTLRNKVRSSFFANRCVHGLEPPWIGVCDERASIDIRECVSFTAALAICTISKAMGRYVNLDAVDEEILLDLLLSEELLKEGRTKSAVPIPEVGTIWRLIALAGFRTGARVRVTSTTPTSICVEWLDDGLDGYLCGRQESYTPVMFSRIFRPDGL